MTANAALSIRPFTSADLDSVIALFLGAIREVGSRDYNPAQIAAWAQVDREAWKAVRLSRPTWIAIRDQTAVGFTDLEPDGHLDMMFVHPDHQGIGVASLLLQTVESAAVAGGHNWIFTEASLTARPFFERRGFQVLAQQQVTKRGQTFINFRMGKTIG